MHIALVTNQAYPNLLGGEVPTCCATRILAEQEKSMPPLDL